MNLEQIRAAQKLGLTVHWANEGYTVHDNSIVWAFGTPKANSIGLTWSDGKTMNGQPDEFFVGRASLTHWVDTAGAGGKIDATLATPDLHQPARYVIFKTLKHGRQVVAVWHYIPNTGVGVDEATELAIDYLLECHSELFQHEAEAVSNLLAVI